MVQREQGHLDIAVQSIRQGLQLDPNSDYLYVCMGRVQEKREQIDAAILSYRKAIQLNERSLLGHNYLSVRCISKAASGSWRTSLTWPSQSMKRLRKSYRSPIQSIRTTFRFT